MTHLQKNARTRILLIIMCMSLRLLSSSAQQVSSGDSSAVNLSLTVMDKNRQAVSTLRKEDLRVLVDGAQQEIIDFKRQTDQPLSVIVMLDMSISQERVIPAAKQVSKEFVNSVIRPDKDSVGVITFTGEAKLEQELTSDLQQVHQAIERVEFKPPPSYVSGIIITRNPPKSVTGQMPQGMTGLWDAVGFTAEKFGAQSPTHPRRVVILITDGQDTSSKLKLSEAAEIAIKFDVVVYSIGISDKYYGGTNDGNLKKISERTGARAFFPERVKDLRATFAEIEQQLHSQYSISLKPSGNRGNGKIPKIKIELVNPELRKQGLLLSYPQSYSAGSN
jgi:VWFA-related protein